MCVCACVILWDGELEQEVAAKVGDQTEDLKNIQVNFNILL